MQGQGSGGGISTGEEGIKEEPVSEEEVSHLKTFRRSHCVKRRGQFCLDNQTL